MTSTFLRAKMRMIDISILDALILYNMFPFFEFQWQEILQWMLEVKMRRQVKVSVRP